MALKAGIEVRGARELRRSAKAAGDDLSDLKEAHNEAAQVVTNAGRQRAPKKEGKLAGTVRGSGTKTAAVVRAGGARARYAGPIHFGWPARHIDANPFLTEAAQETESSWVGIYEQTVEKVLNRIEGV